ncbi:MAG: phosphoenolpyruvate synthase [candidate division Zixibacteria bacterium]|nr:phosphoenolpyruvate synthase [candidate division Zixibacteria bacterium]NIR63719.1 phosphoenolpyruvate synthase [candidate division Zixibacteria bacterium]NIS14676.1 phosphoenolpyruvate synthase [candidate division Zixibacteria bacterium]NIS45675.1 phosphoenolpyruvate synthase [candidate division Zixibacteria bacterium]NIT51204.1 phosphoenolpyruvate synthase [candidate division Zixibacteria bacterium]
MHGNGLILWFEKLGMKDVSIVGGKSASLGEMYQNLSPRGIQIPNGFAITADAFFYFLDNSGLRDEIKKVLSDLNPSDLKALRTRGQKVREMIRASELPADLCGEISANYELMEKQYGPRVDVAIRSSGTAEDLPEASFAGQHDSFLNIRGQDQIIAACKNCFASLFTDRAISYRQAKGFDHFSIGLSVAVQKMIRSDMASSGVMFTIDTESGHKDIVLINASYGLGEGIVQGAMSPDEFYVHKPTLALGYKSIISKTLGSKKVKMIYGDDGLPTKTIEVPERERKQFSIDDEEILKLARWAVTIEEHYSNLAGQPTPMDIEWARDGMTGELFILQARPETVVSHDNKNVLENYHIRKRGRVLVTGSPVGNKIGVGKANLIKDVKSVMNFNAGDVLVTQMTDPDWEPYMKIAAAIVTNEGGRTSHAAIISRELGIPAVVGAEGAMQKITNGSMISVSCAEGDIGRVYEGQIEFDIEVTKLDDIKRPNGTEMKMIFGTPELAFKTSMIPNDGVGLAREEFIISSYIKIHPMALVNYPNLSDSFAKKEIDDLTAGYDDKKQYYVDKLAHGIAMIAAAFYPREVIVRLADFRSNEYADLIGGKQFEPTERNPMIGWRGASRYYDPSYRPAFDLECQALRAVRNDKGFSNVKIMIPFCRTVAEGRKVIEIMAENGLRQGENELEIYMMCEIPSNVILADHFAEIFDGFSIGSNDLTQLTLGLDRDSGHISHIGDENDESIKRMISHVIKVAKERNRKIGICGQAPSDFPDFAKFLVREGIDSISLNPDSIIKTSIVLSEIE